MADSCFFSLSPELHLHIGGFLALRDLANLSRTSSYFQTLFNDSLLPDAPKFYWRKQLQLYRKLYEKCDEIYAVRSISILLHDIFTKWGFPAKLSESEKKQDFHIGKPYPKWMHWPIVQTAHIFVILDHLFTEEYAFVRLPVLDYIDCEKLLQRLEKDFVSLKALQKYTKFEIKPVDNSNSSLERTSFIYKVLALYFALSDLTPAKAPAILLSAVGSDHFGDRKTDVEAAVVELYSLLSLFLEFYEVAARTDTTKMAFEFLTVSAARILRTRMEEYIAFYYAPNYKSGMDESGLTAEQTTVVNTDVEPGDLVKVQAYAGTGKTRCLWAFAASRPYLNILYVAYNKSMQQEAATAFPPNVQCRTIHSLAYREMDVYAPDVFKNRKQFNNLRASDVIWALELDIPKARSAYEQVYDKNRAMPWPTANRVIETINRFCHSADREMTEEHVPKSFSDILVLKKFMFLGWAKRVWTMMMKSEMSINHDVYLKLLQLSAERGGERCMADQRIFGDYQCILFDEAQDATPCSADIILRQRPYVGILMVGDPYQMIYQFKGANNCAFAEDLYPSTHKFYLTESFRFGNKIARAANVVLRKLNETVPVSGVKDSEDEVMCRYIFREVGPGTNGNQDANNSFKVAERKPFTMIFRKNKTLLAKLLQIKAKFQRRKVFLLTAADFSPDKLIDLLQQAHDLAKHQKRCTHPALKRFEKWSDLIRARENLNENEFDFPHVVDLVCSAAPFIVQDTATFTDKLEKMRATFVNREEEADIVLATCHQAKGREWDNVEVSDDFSDAMGFGSDGSEEEWNMLYVAVTRARKRLLLSKFAAELYINAYGRNRIYLTKRVPYQTTVYNVVHLTKHRWLGPSKFTKYLKKDMDTMKFNLSCKHHADKDNEHLMVEEETVMPYGSFLYKEAAWQECFDSAFARIVPQYCLSCMQAKIQKRPDIYFNYHANGRGIPGQGRIMDIIYTSAMEKTKASLQPGSQTRFFANQFDKVFKAEDTITNDIRMQIPRFKISSEIERYPTVQLDYDFHWNTRQLQLAHSFKSAFTTLTNEPHDPSDYAGVPSEEEDAEPNLDSDSEDSEAYDTWDAPWHMPHPYIPDFDDSMGDEDDEDDDDFSDGLGDGFGDPYFNDPLEEPYGDIDAEDYDDDFFDAADSEYHADLYSPPPNLVPVGAPVAAGGNVTGAMADVWETETNTTSSSDSETETESSESASEPDLVETDSLSSGSEESDDSLDHDGDTNASEGDEGAHGGEEDGAETDYDDDDSEDGIYNNGGLYDMVHEIAETLRNNIATQSQMFNMALQNFQGYQNHQNGGA